MTPELVNEVWLACVAFQKWRLPFVHKFGFSDLGSNLMNLNVFWPYPLTETAVLNRPQRASDGAYLTRNAE